jgi:hypothetical protein
VGSRDDDHHERAHRRADHAADEAEGGALDEELRGDVPACRTERASEAAATRTARIIAGAAVQRLR